MHDLKDRKYIGFYALVIIFIFMTITIPTVSISNNTVLGKDNNDLEKRYDMGCKQFRNKNYSLCIAIENEVIKKDANFYKAYNLKGIAFCFSGNFKSGMHNIDKALKIKSDYGYARFNKALAYELYGLYDDALKWYDNDLKIEKYVWSYYGKASIYGRRGDVNNTIKNLKLAIKLDPYAKIAARGEKDFDKVKNNKEFRKLIY
jgi:tetratricopeptide (TPR) repeat protein